jgi:hypothetical protein
MFLNRYRYNRVRLYFHSSGRENFEYHMIFLNRIGIAHHANYVEEIYVNVSYGLIRMYVKGKFFLYATTHPGRGRQRRYIAPRIINPAASRTDNKYRVKLSLTSHEGWEVGWNVGLPPLLWYWAQLGGQSCQLYAPCRTLPQEIFLVVISVTGWVKEEVTWKFPRTLQGIEPETSSLVA